MKDETVGQRDRADPSSSLRRNADYLRLTIGEVFSTMGGAASNFALPLVVLSITGSPWQASLAVAAATAGAVSGSLIAGGFVDRLNRRATMVFSLALRSLAWSGVGAMIAVGRWNLSVVVTACVISGFLASVYQAAESGTLKTIVPPEQFPTAVAVIEGRGAAASLLGAPLGALLLGVSRALPFGVNAASYLASLVGILSIKRRLGRPQHRPPSSVVAEWAEGFRYARGRRPFATVVVAMSVLNLISNAYILSYILLLQSRETSTWVIASFQTVIGGSLLVGAVLAPHLVRRVPLGRMLIGSPLIRCAFIASYVFWNDNPWWVIATTGFAFLISPASNAGWGAYMAVTTPDRFQGRISSFEEFAATSLMPMAPLLAGVLLSNATPSFTFGALAVLGFVMTAGLAFSAAIRGLPLVSTAREVQ